MQVSEVVCLFEQCVRMQIDKLSCMRVGLAVVSRVVDVLQIPLYAIEYVTFQPGSVVVVLTLSNESYSPAPGNVTQVGWYSTCLLACESDEFACWRTVYTQWLKIWHDTCQIEVDLLGIALHVDEGKYTVLCRPRMCIHHGCRTVFTPSTWVTNCFRRDYVGKMQSKIRNLEFKHLTISNCTHRKC